MFHRADVMQAARKGRREAPRGLLFVAFTMGGGMQTINRIGCLAGLRRSGAIPANAGLGAAGGFALRPRPPTFVVPWLALFHSLPVPTVGDRGH